MKLIVKSFLVAVGIFINGQIAFAQKQTAVDFVNPYMGNISHLLVPTFPTIHIPNSMLRVYPQRDDFTGDRLHGLPLILTSHRGKSAFNLSPYASSAMLNTDRPMAYSYDNEKITPYGYNVFLDEEKISVSYAVSEQSAIYSFTFEGNKTPHVKFGTADASIKWDGKGFSARESIGNNTWVYIYAIPSAQPEKVVYATKGSWKTEPSDAVNSIDLTFPNTLKKLFFKYGISFISEQQAQKNLTREIKGFDFQHTLLKGKAKWNEKLNKIKVHGATNSNDKAIFYTSLYRTFERPVNISEDGQYFSAFDGKVHSDEGKPFYTDDWIWDSYRAHHPLNVLIDGKKEEHILQSFIRMSAQMPNFWLPTFPEINGDSRRMNSNHGVATILDAYRKGLRNFDLALAYKAAKGAITEKTLAPWSGKPAGKLDQFFYKNGYIPALADGEKETIAEVDGFERRQPVAVTLGTAYDLWCLGEIAKILGYKEDFDRFNKMSFVYRNLYNAETKFFHPKDENGNFLKPFDYVFSGGQGARGAYGENNGWIYKWDVQHNIPDLIALMGGNEAFTNELDKMFNQPLGRSKFDFYAQLPDHTGNVGQFSMANEPSLHIPYLYNYAGQPWKTQKRIKQLVRQWFRNDLMGMPGDEDGGGMSSFVVFSQLGFYPVTPGSTSYSIGSPFFQNAVIQLENGKTFTVVATNLTENNKYIKEAKLNGKPLLKSQIEHSQIMAGGILSLTMSDKPTKLWVSN